VQRLPLPHQLPFQHLPRPAYAATATLLQAQQAGEARQEARQQKTKAAATQEDAQTAQAVMTAAQCLVAVALV